MRLSKAPSPLYPPYSSLSTTTLADLPTVALLIDQGEDWWLAQWGWGKEFLSFIGRNKSEHTFTRFRTEVERYLLWSFQIKCAPINEFRKADVLEFIDFCWCPSGAWVGTANIDRFRLFEGQLVANSGWRPYVLNISKSKRKRIEIAGLDVKHDKKSYRPSAQSLEAVFTALSSFYNHLYEREICFGNPVKIAKKDCRHLIKFTDKQEVKRLSGDQWDYVLGTARIMADADSLHERSLFVVATLKSHFLRVSELSERPAWAPVMGHFYRNNEGNWLLKIFGKMRKVRDVTVPDAYLYYLDRYRRHRGLSGLPLSGDKEPIVSKVRGQGGMSSRHLTRIIQSVFDEAFNKMKAELGEVKADDLLAASAHWLRHTGASMEVERGTPIKEISEELGHSSSQFTDSQYVHSDLKARIDRGKLRDV